MRLGVSPTSAEQLPLDDDEDDGEKRVDRTLLPPLITVLTSAMFGALTTTCL